MKKFYSQVVKYRNLILIFFIIIFLISLFAWNLVLVNYDINDYLPQDSPSTIAIDVMEAEFEGAIPNARVMINNVSIPEALRYKDKINQVDGVTEVRWLDDLADLDEPIENIDSKTLNTYYKDNNVLFTVAIEEEKRIDAVAEIREIIGDNNQMTGSAVSTAVATTSTVAEVSKIAIVAVIFVLLVLLLTTDSWLEPFLVLVGLGVAIVINSGTNLIFGEISFVTNAAGSILQLAVSLDYSVFLIHRFEECLKNNSNAQEAMVEALCKSTSSILSSGLTTVIGFLALVLMQFRLGPDLGLALAKGVAISLLTVFLLMPSLILFTYKYLNKTRHRPFVPEFKKFGKIVGKLTVPLVILFILIVIPSYLASNANDYFYGASHIFGPDTQLGQDTETIDNIFGDSDTYVLLIPKGDTATETELSDEINNIDEVTEVISFVDEAGAEIPTEYLDQDQLKQLESQNYDRMVISVGVPLEGDKAFDIVEKIRALGQKYYPNNYYLAGEGVSTYDLKQTVTADMVKVNFLAIGAVFLVLVLSFKSIILPIILVLTIETAIWINLAIPYFSGSTCFYIAYLIITSVQLGATVDYAILMTDRYRENRETLSKKEAISETISEVTVSILTSGSVLTVVGLLMSYFSSNQLLAQIGLFIGRGAILSLITVMFILPGLLLILDRFVTGKVKKEKGIKNLKLLVNHE